MPAEMVDLAKKEAIEWMEAISVVVFGVVNKDILERFGE